MYILAFFIGAAIVALTLASAVKTFVLPRSAPDGIVRAVFLFIRTLFNLRVLFSASYRERDWVMAYYAPVSLLALLPVWLGLVMIGFTGMFWAAGIGDWITAFHTSGSSLLSLGLAANEGLLDSILKFSEATIGFLLVALLISYLPTMYSAFSRRESAVTLLEVRAGNPPSAVEMLLRFYRIHGLNRLVEQWRAWETWFADIQESHTSLPALVFFRSPLPEHSWVNAAGTILDTASLTLAVVDIPHDPQADLCIRAGYLALRHIAGFFKVEYDPNPRPTDPISITRQQFDVACLKLEDGGVPLKPDREKAWYDFAGWRVNYDRVLLALTRLTMAPEAPWTSMRSSREILAMESGGIQENEVSSADISSQE